MKKYKYLYGGEDPVPSKNKKPVTVKGPSYVTINPKTTPEMQKINVSSNLAQALRFKNLLTGVNKDLVPSGDYANQVEGISTNQQVGGGSRAYTQVDPVAINKADSVINSSRDYLFKPKFDQGGQKKPDIANMLGKTPTTFETNATESAKYANSILDATKPAKEPSNFNLGNALGNAAPFLDNLANLVTASKTPDIPTPILTEGPRLKTKINVNPALRRINNDVTAASKGIDMTTGSAGVAAANKGKLIADKWRAIGDVEANKQNQEAQLENTAAMADYQSRSANNTLVNQRNFNQMQRQDDINQRYGDVLSDFGSDIANINREKNLMAKDKESLKLLMKVNPDTAYQFADTATFENLYKDDEKGLKDLIMSQKGSVQREKLVGLYQKLYKKQFQG